MTRLQHVCTVVQVNQDEGSVFAGSVFTCECLVRMLVCLQNAPRLGPRTRSQEESHPHVSAAVDAAVDERRKTKENADAAFLPEAVDIDAAEAPEEADDAEAPVEADDDAVFAALALMPVEYVLDAMGPAGIQTPIYWPEESDGQLEREIWHGGGASNVASPDRVFLTMEGVTRALMAPQEEVQRDEFTRTLWCVEDMPQRDDSHTHTTHGELPSVLESKHAFGVPDEM
jgi:hypothetical protein